jgi:branched-chain amino acid transport system substrate-binding protein
LTNIKAANPEAIFIPGYYTDVANIAKQIRALGITVPLLGGDGWESVTNIGGDAIQGAYYSNHYSADEPRAEVKDFVQKYEAKYHSTPDSMAALAHDAMYIVKNAVEHSDMGGDLAAQRKAVRDAIAQTKDFQGVTGKITMDANRNATKPAVVLKIVGKSTTAAASISPQ